MATAWTSSQPQQDITPSPRNMAGICDECLFLHQSIATIIQGWRVGKDPPDPKLQFTRTNTLLPKSQQCFLCARLWYILRLAKHCLTGAALMTEDETLEFLQRPDLRGMITFNLKIARYTETVFLADVTARVEELNIAACRFTVKTTSKTSDDLKAFQWWKPCPHGSMAEIEIGSRQVDDDDLTSDQARPVAKMRLMEIRKYLQNCDANHDCWENVVQNFACIREKTSSDSSDKQMAQLNAQFQSNLKVSVATEPTSFLPKRLLKFEKAGKLRLVETANLDTSGLLRYATLSHCWGPVPFKTLTCANLEDAKRDIPLQDLGRTFQEAIELCRQLNIQYLWIDSWCIIQDSPQEGDWRAHVGEMQNIYALACFNIAAASSSSCSQGLFRPYQKHLHQSWKVQIADLQFDWVSKGDGKIEALLWRSAPLFKRAWVVQELFLAARVIFFGEAGLYFKCQSGFRTEPEYPDTRSVFHNLQPLSLIHAAPRLPDDQLTVFELDQAWARKVADYSGCHLTKRSDRIVAFLSLATYFAARYSSLDPSIQYLVGGWDRDPIAWLDWRNASRGKKPAVDSSFVGYPSWAWLSYPQTVSMPLTESVFFGDPSIRNDGQYMTRYVDRTIILQELENPFGPYLRAQLRLEGPVFSLAIRSNEWRPTNAYDADIFEHRSWEVSYERSTRTIEFQGEGATSLVLPIGSVFVDDSLLIDCTLDFDYEESTNSDQPLECIYLREKRTFQTLDYRFILVKKMNQNDNGGDLPEFKRVGVINVVEDQNTQQHLNQTPQQSFIQFTNRSISNFFESYLPIRQFYLQ